MLYLRLFLFAGGVKVIWRGISRPDSDRLPFVRQYCPIWWYRLSTIGVGLILLAICAFV
jgi:hypothetical protein